MTKRRTEPFEWEAEHLRILIKMWPNYTAREIAAVVGCDVKKIANMGSILRKNGIHLEPKMSQKGKLQSIIDEVKKEQEQKGKLQNITEQVIKREQREKRRWL